MKSKTVPPPKKTIVKTRASLLKTHAKHPVQLLEKPITKKGKDFMASKPAHLASPIKNNKVVAK